MSGELIHGVTYWQNLDCNKYHKHFLYFENLCNVVWFNRPSICILEEEKCIGLYQYPTQPQKIELKTEAF